MTDRRLTPANTRVAASHLQGQVDAARYVAGTEATVICAVTDLCAAPKGPRDRQLLLGAAVKVFEDHDGWSFVQAVTDGYVGYVRSGTLGLRISPTHVVGTPATHAYADEDMKSADVMALPFGAKVVVRDEREAFFETSVGFVPKKHLRPMAQPFTDPATIAQMHYGVPYLWGGNSTRGIDCSGLVQAALLACGSYCPGDSDMQMAETGEALADDADLQRGDLVFWDGHVGMMVDAQTMIHANAHHMACVYEPLKDATLRIKAQGDGDILMRKRI